MTVIYRTDGPWGTGLGSDLTPDQVDGNFWQLVQDITAKAVQGVGISNFVVNGGEMTVVLTDHSLLGPYPLPLAKINFRGEWAADTGYFANDVITESGSTYMVLANHTSAATFDPFANNGSGQDYYGLLLTNPELHLPAGGSIGQVLSKTSALDYITAWTWQRLAGLHDVLASPAPVSGDLVYWNGSHFSYLSQGAITFAGLADVAIATPLSGQPVVYNGTKFANSNKVDMPWFAVTTAGPTITLDRANGENQTLTINGDVTLAFTGWPATGRLGRVCLRIINNGFTVTWPSVLWPDGVAPTDHVAATSIYTFMSYNGGSVIYGNLYGHGYA